MTRTLVWVSVPRVLAFAAAILITVPLISQQSPQPHGPEVVPSYMDLSVKPGDDFYEYANGAWEKRTQIRPDRAYESRVPIFTTNT